MIIIRPPPCLYSEFPELRFGLAIALLSIRLVDEIAGNETTSSAKNKLASGRRNGM
jgi:hypothetical protein